MGKGITGGGGGGKKKKKRFAELGNALGTGVKCGKRKGS